MSAETTDEWDDTIGPISALRPPRRPDHIRPIDWERMSYWQRQRAARKAAQVPPPMAVVPTDPDAILYVFEGHRVTVLRAAASVSRHMRDAGRRDQIPENVQALTAAYVRWTKASKAVGRPPRSGAFPAERLAQLASEGHTLTSAALALRRPRKSLDRQLRQSPERLEILRRLQRNEAAR